MSQTMWTAATVVAVLGCGLFGWILKKLIKAYKEVDEGYQPLQLQFKYAASDVKGEDRRFSLLFVPMVFYVGLALAVVTHNASAVAWVRQAMYVLAAAGCFFAFVETMLLAFGRAKAAAPVCGLIKWGCFAVWTLGMFAGLVLKGWAL